MRDTLTRPDSQASDAELAALRDGSAAMSTYFARLAGAILGGRIAELAVELTEGQNVPRERQLPLIFERIDADVGRLRSIANRHTGRLLAEMERQQREDLDYRRRQAKRDLNDDYRQGRIEVNTTTGRIRRLHDEPPSDQEITQHDGHRPDAEA